jgi:predicted RND superfamily exporter protein
MIRSLFEKAARYTARHPWTFLGVCAVLSGLGVWSVTQLPLHTSRKALYRADNPTVQRLDRYLEGYGASSDLIVAIEGAPRPVLEEFASELVAVTETLPQVRNSDAQVDLSFFLHHAYLMVPPADLERAPTYVETLLQMPEGAPADIESALKSAENYFDDPPPIASGSIDLASAQAALDGLDFFLEEWQRWLAAAETPRRIAWDKLLANHPEARDLVQGNGYYASRDGRMLFVFVRAADPSEDFSVIGPFYRGVRKAATDLQDRYRAAGRPVPRFGLTGNPAVVYEEFTSVTDSTLFVVGSAAVLVLLLIVFIFRSLRRALIVFIPMGMGALWGFLATWLFVGHMTMITMAFTAILFGLGVDYGIFLSSRILEEIRNGRSLEDAIAIGAGAAAGAVLTAGGATILIFVVLGTVEFKGFSELGVVGAIGVCCVQLSTFMGLPALFAVLKPVPRKGLVSETTTRPTEPGRPMPRPLSAVIVGIALAAAVFGSWAGLRLPVNYDVLALLPRDSEAAHYSRRMIQESEYQSEVVILTARDLDEARRFTAEAQAMPTVGKVQTIVDMFPVDAEIRAEAGRQVSDALARSSLVHWVLGWERIDLPDDGPARIAAILDRSLDQVEDFQEAAFSAGHGGLVESIEKVRVRIKDIARTLRSDPRKAGRANERFLNRLLGDAQELARGMLSWKDARPLVPSDLPPNLGGRFFGQDGSVAVYLIPKQSIYDVEFLDNLLSEVYSISPDATGFPTTHQVMSRSAFGSFKNGTLIAVGVALLFLLIVLRNFTAFAVAALPLLIGEGWMLGVLAIGNIPYNYGNMIALPLLMALALDYGVWFAHRHKELRDLGPWQVIRVAGVPILLAALTTLAGLGAITFADYRGISSMGLAVTIGLVCCLACAMFISPAVAQLLDRRKR